MKPLVDTLKAVGEPTRLRMLALLRRCELTTSELCQILGQTQPRVSRHLKLLADAGLLIRHAEGVRAYYRLVDAGSAFEVLRSVLDQLEIDDPQLVNDELRLAQVRSERADKASNYFSSVAADWDQIRRLHVPDDDVEEALLASLANASVQNLLDIGTGTGRMLQLFAGRAEAAVGIDHNPEMLNLARSNLDGPDFRHCFVRKGSAYALDIESDTVDVAILHQVLHFLEEPLVALKEAVRALRPGGQLLVVDFDAHQIERLRSEYNHVRLGFSNDQVNQWFKDLGLRELVTRRFTPARSSQENLTVKLWSATIQADSQTQLPRERTAA